MALNAKKVVEENILGSIWGAFGQVSNVHYHSEYLYCFLSFPSHSAAKKAIADLNDQTLMRAAINRIIEAQVKPEAKDFTKMVTGCFL